MAQKILQQQIERQQGAEDGNNDIEENNKEEGGDVFKKIVMHAQTQKQLKRQASINKGQISNISNFSQHMQLFQLAARQARLENLGFSFPVNLFKQMNNLALLIGNDTPFGACIQEILEDQNSLQSFVT
jgi:hypothetical protein